MSHHPCDSHGCDHCFICDHLGICCGTISAAERALLLAGAASPAAGSIVVQRLRDAMDVRSRDGAPVRRTLRSTGRQQAAVVAGLAPAALEPATAKATSAFFEKGVRRGVPS